jgi:hypothetical protein
VGEHPKRPSTVSDVNDIALCVTELKRALNMSLARAVLIELGFPFLIERPETKFSQPSRRGRDVYAPSMRPRVTVNRRKLNTPG